MKKKILFVINTMGQAGAEKALVELLYVLDPNKYDIDLLAMIPRGEMFAQIPSYVHVLNKHYSSKSVLSLSGQFYLVFRSLYAFFYHFNGFRMIPYFMRCIKDTNHQIKKDKLLWNLISKSFPQLDTPYDVAVAYLEGASTYYVSRLDNTDKKISFVHTEYAIAGYHPTIDAGCYDRIDRIYAVANEVKKSFIKIYPQYENKVHIFRNVINKDRIQTLAKEGTGLQSFDGVNLLTVGRLHFQKGYDMAVKVCGKLKNDGYPVRWYVLGEGPLRSNIEKWIKEEKVEEDFILLGAKSNPYPYFASCDIYVHASRVEGKSIAIEEAQVLGKAIVASRCSGTDEQIKDGVDGFIVNFELDEIVDAIEKVINHPELKKQFETNILEKKWDYMLDLEAFEKFVEGGQTDE